MIYLRRRGYTLINEVQNGTVLPLNNAQESINFNLSCVVTIYYLCYSLIKSFSNWNSNTLATIVENNRTIKEEGKQGIRQINMS